MALRVWLPLNGNLNNQGISACNPVQTATPTYIDGKLGKALNAGSFYLPAAEVSKFYNNNAMSFAFWIYAFGTATGGGTNIIGDNSMTEGARVYTIFQYPNPQDLHISWMNDESTAPDISAIYTNALGLDKWTHVAITYNGSIILVYIDGVLSYTTYGTLNRTNYNCDIPIADRSAVRYMSDIRIYDHVLSAKEVKEISRGLILHYPLTGSGRYGLNLALNTNTDTDSGKFIYSQQVGDAETTFVYEDGIACIKILRGDIEHSGWSYLSYRRIQRSLLKPATWYTVSFDVKTSIDAWINLEGIKNGNATDQLSESSYAIQSNTKANEWSHIVWKTKLIDSFDDVPISNQYIYMYCNWMNTPGRWMIMKNMKLEEGEIDTPWSPNPSDDAYAQMGYNDNIEYDSSGYCNNSSERVSVITNSNTIKYNTSTYFDGNSYITLQPFNIDLSSITFSFWANWSDFKSWSRIFDFGTVRVTSVQSNGILCANNSTKAQLVVHIYYDNSSVLNTTNIMPITPNTWYHVVITTTKNVCNLYINGELYESFQLPKELGRAQLNYNYLGKSNWAADSLFNGNISDFRIYGTVLSDEDVKELYEQSAFIDNKGNIGCYEFVES